MNNQYNTKNLNHIRNFIDVSKSMAINSIGEIFSIGEFAYDETKPGTKIFIIKSFSLDEYKNEVIAESDLGSFRIDDIKNLYSDTGIVEESDSCGIESTYGIEEVKKERISQIEKHGFTSTKDKKHINGELLQAAKFCINDIDFDFPESLDDSFKYKILKKNKLQRLITSAAFIIAEIDRIKTLDNERSKFTTKELLENCSNDIDDLLPKL